MPGVDFEAIKAAISCEELARRELPMRGRRAKCPFNPDERRFNLAFLQDGGCYCFSCREAHDVIQLAAAIWHVTDFEAAQMLAEELHIGPSTNVDVAAIRAARAAEAARKREEKARADAAFAAACEDERAAGEALAAMTAADADGEAFSAMLRRLGRAQTTLDAMTAGW